MRSLLLEFHRFNDLESGSWVKGAPYLVASASHPVREFRIEMEHDDFLDLMAGLRYRDTAIARTEALKQVGEIATKFLGIEGLKDILEPGGALQLDLVVNPAELAALPFEAATTGNGEPLFARSEPAVVLTRRVRHDFVEERQPWPASPRVLYAWARPDESRDVPSAEHERALLDALKPWIPLPDLPGDTLNASSVLTTVPDASLRTIKETCEQAVRVGKPFTHVHLLAHGAWVGEEHRKRFGIALHGDSGEAEVATPEDLAKALAPLVGYAKVVTLASCDSANRVNTTTSKKSVAHILHVSGFPIVVASQLPLTVVGSNLLAQMFYKELLSGQDVRRALHDVRVALYENRKTTGHDWASLVGYAQLPEGYHDHLHVVRLKAVLAKLKTIQGSSDNLVKRCCKDAARFDDVAKMLQERIGELDTFRQDAEKAGRREGRDENLGLLGSAQKRMSELCFVRSELGDKDRWRQLMRDALTCSRDWYREGYEGALSAHWNGVQYLSLEAALDGRIANPGRWHAALTAADIAKRSSKADDAAWALGSLAELYLLARFAGQTIQTAAAQSTLTQMNALVLEKLRGEASYLETTRRQFQRYVDWWTTANGFFPGTPDLSAEAKVIVELLDSMVKGVPPQAERK